MTLVQAIFALFSGTAPAGVDFQAAFNAAKGKKFEDLSEADVSTLDAVADSFQDFTADPAGWLKSASSTDPRRSWWTQLVQALGALVSATPGGSSQPAGSTEPAASAATEPEPEAEQGIDPDALAGGAPPSSRREGGGGGGGGGVVVRGDGEGDDRPKRDKKRRKGRDRDEEEDEEDDDERDNRRQRRDHKPPELPPPPKPLFDVNDRTIPAKTREILAYSSYKSWSAMIIEAFRLIRTGTSAQQSQKRAEIPHARRIIGSMKASTTRMEVQAGIHLERLLEALESGLDLHRPGYFQAMYITGGDYTD